MNALSHFEYLEVTFLLSKTYLSSCQHKIQDTLKNVENLSMNVTRIERH